MSNNTFINLTQFGGVNESNESITTFTDALWYFVLYYYTYFLVILAMIVFAAVFEDKIRLYYKSHLFILNIRKTLTKIEILINYHQVKHKISKLTSDELIKYKLLSKEKELKRLTKSLLKEYTNKQFDIIIVMVNNLRKAILKRIDELEEPDHDDNKIIININSSNNSDVQLTLKENKINQVHKHKIQMEQMVQSGSITPTTGAAAETSTKTETQAETKTPEIEEEKILGKKQNEMTDMNEAATRQVVIVEEKEEEEDIGQKLEFEYLEELVVKKLRKGKSRKSFVERLWNLKGLIWTGASHYFDTVTDIALIWEFYQLHKAGTYDDNRYGIRIYSLFICSVLTTVYYRVASMYHICRFTRSIKEGLLQFIFDHYLIKMIYVNLFKMNSTKALEMLSLMRGIEGGNESAFQAIISLIFLFITGFNFNESSSIITLVSFVFSLLSLVSRFIALDKYKILPKARTFIKAELIGIGGGGIFSNGKIHLNRINLYYILQWFVRINDVVSNLLVLVLISQYLYGLFLFFIIGFGILGYVMFEYSESRVKSAVPTDWIRHLLVRPVTYTNNRSKSWLFTLDNCQLIVVLIFFVETNFKGWPFVLYWVFCRLLLVVGRLNYGIIDNDNDRNLSPKYDLTSGYLRICGGLGIAKETEEELELDLCNFIYNKNKECILFSYFLLEGYKHNPFGDSNDDKQGSLCCDCCFDQQRSSFKSCITLGSSTPNDYIKNIHLLTLWIGDQDVSVFLLMKDLFYKTNTNPIGNANVNTNINAVYTYNDEYDNDENEILILKKYLLNKIENDLKHDKNEQMNKLLQQSCRNKDLFVVSQIIKYKDSLISDINAQDSEGNTALHWIMWKAQANKDLQTEEDCIDSDEAKIAKLLIDAGIDETIKNSYQQTAKDNLNDYHSSDRAHLYNALTTNKLNIAFD